MMYCYLRKWNNMSHTNVKNEIVRMNDLFSKITQSFQENEAGTGDSFPGKMDPLTRNNRKRERNSTFEEQQRMQIEERFREWDLKPGVMEKKSRQVASGHGWGKVRNLRRTVCRAEPIWRLAIKAKPLWTMATRLEIRKSSWHKEI